MSLPPENITITPEMIKALEREFLPYDPFPLRTFFAATTLKEMYSIRWAFPDLSQQFSIYRG